MKAFLTKYHVKNTFKKCTKKWLFLVLALLVENEWQIDSNRVYGLLAVAMGESARDRENFDVVRVFVIKKQLNICTERNICRREKLFMCSITIDIL